MDAIFLTNDPNTRKHLIGSLAQSFGSLYVCLWSYYFPRPSNYLISLDGYYNEASTSSFGSLARTLFHEYRQSVIPLQNGHVPSMAFMNNVPYVEIRPQDIQRLCYNDAQRLFYQEARIQTVIFMGCRSGEIELGLTYDAGNMKLEASLREWFPQDFNRSKTSSPVNSDSLRPPPPRSSSSSSLRSLDSPQTVSEYSSLLFPLIPKPSTTTNTVSVPLHQPSNMIHQQQQESLFRNRELEEEAMTQAILAVLSGPVLSSPPSTSSFPQRKGRATAFKKYYCVIGDGRSGRAPPLSTRKQSMMKRAILFYNRLNVYRRERFAREIATSGGGSGDGSGVRYNSGPSATQLHHMISERKRREKLNESFQALRSLLPPGTKKDKASVLATAREKLNSLQGEVLKLLERIREQEEKVAGEREMDDLRPDERFNVRIRVIPESTSRERFVDLRVVVRGENIRVDDLMIRLLEFFKRINNVSLVSVEARTRTRTREDGDTSVVLVSLRIKIEDEWDESTFQEAVSRVVADLAH